MIEKSIVPLLNEAGKTLCTAESLTGGLLAGAICGVPGASGCFLGGVIAYQDQIKANMLSVSEKTLADYSAVSAKCAREMAAGVREKFGADYALSTTGYAGPGGEDVGLVFIGLATKNGAKAHRLHVSGSRQGIRRMTVNMALYLLKKEIKNYGEESGKR